MLKAKRQLSPGSVDEHAVGRPIQRRRSSITQVSISRTGGSDNGDGNICLGRDQEIEGNPSTSRHTMYNQPSSSGIICNGAIYGDVHSSIQTSTLDGFHFLYQHAAIGAIHESNERHPPPLCHAGTRDVVIGRAITWYMDKSGRKKILWVHAPAGFGKSSVAGSVIEKLKAMMKEQGPGFDTIGATFFFCRNSPERNSPARFILTLAYQLARSIPDLRALVDIIVKNEPDIVKMALEHQLEKLIVEPFESLPNLEVMPTRLVIVDGIDECINSDRESHEIVQTRVLDLIRCLHSHQLPLSLLFLSRPEAWIKQHLSTSAFREVVEPLDLYEVGDHVNDVKKFVRAELSRITTLYGLGNADDEWPEEKWLVLRSRRQMIYAATVIRHIDDPYGDSRQLLKDIVDGSSATGAKISGSTPFSPLYDLYNQIMRSCPERNRTLLMEVLGDLMCDAYFEDWASKAAFSVLERVSRRPPGSLVRALRPLHAILRFGKDIPIYELFIHPSFEEFLRNQTVSSDFFVDVNTREEVLLSNMLECMTSITKDTIGKELDGVARFALCNWCKFWDDGKATFLKFITTHLHMMKKIIALDLTTCIIQSYCIPRPTRKDSALKHIFASPKPSEFLVDFVDLDGCGEALPTIHYVTSHLQSSLDDAFTILLQATTLPPWAPRSAISLLGKDCVEYLGDVTTQRDWRKNKVIQALAAPGPDGGDLFEEVVGWLHVELRFKLGNEEWARDLLAHIYDVMVRNQHPILEAEDHPFVDFLRIRDGVDGSDTESDSESDS